MLGPGWVSVCGAVKQKILGLLFPPHSHQGISVTPQLLARALSEAHCTVSAAWRMVCRLVTLTGLRSNHITVSLWLEEKYWEQSCDRGCYCSWKVRRISLTKTNDHFTNGKERNKDISESCRVKRNKYFNLLKYKMTLRVTAGEWQLVFVTKRQTGDRVSGSTNLRGGLPCYLDKGAQIIDAEWMALQLKSNKVKAFSIETESKSWWQQRNKIIDRN